MSALKIYSVNPSTLPELVQATLFQQPESIALPGADIRYWPAWVDAGMANRWMQNLCEQIEWSRHRVRIFGKEHESPRWSAWVGDANAVYRYSGVCYQPDPWSDCLLEIRQLLKETRECIFNSVLLNRYCDGAHSMGWHSDDEPELGPRPVIASISLGATRRFRFRSRTQPRSSTYIDLAHGSLLLMGGQTQALYQHALAKTQRPVGERINLTFRQIFPHP